MCFLSMHNYSLSMKDCIHSKICFPKQAPSFYTAITNKVIQSVAYWMKSLEQSNSEMKLFGITQVVDGRRNTFLESTTASFGTARERLGPSILNRFAYHTKPLQVLPKEESPAKVVRSIFPTQREHFPMTRGTFQC